MEEQCFEDVKVEGKDTHTGKRVTGHWPRDMPNAQVQYLEWLKKVRDPYTLEYYPKRDIYTGNTIKGTGPRHLVRQIVRIRRSDGKEYLYSNGYSLGYNVVGKPVSMACSNPETWQRTHFRYKKEYDPKIGTMKTKPEGPSMIETVHELPFNEKNLKLLYDKRVNPNDLIELGQRRKISLAFCVKNEDNGVVREVKDVTGIEHKTLDLFMKEFDYLLNYDYISPQQKQQLRLDAQDSGVLPRDAHAQNQLIHDEKLNKPPSGTYG
jgi:hypothetical protein